MRGLVAFRSQPKHSSFSPGSLGGCHDHVRTTVRYRAVACVCPCVSVVVVVPSTLLAHEASCQEKTRSSHSWTGFLFSLVYQTLRLPFFFIDCGIIAMVTFWASGLKAADEARNLQEKREFAAKLEAQKQAKAGQKAAQRAEASQQKHQQRGKHNNGNISHNGPTNHIQQPDKSKKTK